MAVSDSFPLGKFQEKVTVFASQAGRSVGLQDASEFQLRCFHTLNP